VNRILLVRLGALGDIVHAIPVAAAVKRSFPQARIDWLVSAKHREILDLVPVIDRRLAINDRADSKGGASLAASIRELRRQHYDAAIDLQGLIKSALISRASGAENIIGFSRKYVREGLASFFYTSVHDPGGDGIYARTETRHVVEINLGLLEPLGIRNVIPEFPIDQVESPALAQMSSAVGGRFALLNPGAAWPNKRWAPQRLAALADALRDRHGLMSVVLWGPGEREIGETVVAHARGSALLSPRTTIADVVALARHALLMVSGDTGPTHLAAAVGTPIVGIYGPTRPERNGPWRPEDVTVSRADSCECHHLRRCVRERMCLMDIDVDEVLDAVERRLASARRG
jgi:heptosyltransferase-1